jgi:iron complex transport system substrate-binding protein
MKKKNNRVFWVLFYLLLLIPCICLIQGTRSRASETWSWQERTLTGRLELLYADQFTVDYYEDEYALVSIADGQRFLVIPEGGKIPEDLEEGIVPLQKPIKNIYLAATSAMDLFRALNGLESIRLSGTREEGWYVEEAKEAMKCGKILYAGKYNAPDYELLLAEKSSLAVESTMIYHNPEVKEKLEQFGIPVLAERSSYESHPLGRTEWIKLYGVLLGKEEDAQNVFQGEAERLEKLLEEESTGKTVAFFYISTNGYANVRKSGDYIAKMIEMAGGKYIFPNLGGEENALSTVNMQMEEFYAKAKDADYLIYNSAIDGELTTVSQLLEKSSLLADFKAVKEGNVWCTGKNLFQETTGLGVLIEDMHTIFTEEENSLEELTYLHRLK